MASRTLGVLTVQAPKRGAVRHEFHMHSKLFGGCAIGAHGSCQQSDGYEVITRSSTIVICECRCHSVSR